MTDTSTDEIAVTRNDARNRYEIAVNGTHAGVAEFKPDAQGRLHFTHTGVEKEFGGRGLGTILVRDAMVDSAERGDEVVPVCPFVVKYLREHEVPGLRVHFQD